MVEMPLQLKASPHNYFQKGEFSLLKLCFYQKKQFFSLFFWICALFTVVIYCIDANNALSAIVDEENMLAEWLTFNRYAPENLPGASISVDLYSLARFIIPQYALFTPLVFINRIICIVVAIFASIQIYHENTIKIAKIQTVYNGKSTYVFDKIIMMTINVFLFYVITCIACALISIYFFHNVTHKEGFAELFVINYKEMLINFIPMIILSAVFAFAASIYISWSVSIAFLTKSPFFSFPLILLLFTKIFNPNNVAYLLFDLALDFNTSGMYSLAQIDEYNSSQSILIFCIYLCTLWFLSLIFKRQNITNRKVGTKQ